MEFGGYERGQIDEVWESLRREQKSMGLAGEFQTTRPISLSDQLGTQCMDVPRRLSIPDFQAPHSENYLTEQLDFNIDELFQDFDSNYGNQKQQACLQFPPPQQIDINHNEIVDDEFNVNSNSNQDSAINVIFQQQQQQQQQQQSNQQQQKNNQQQIKKLQVGCDRSQSVTSNDTFVVEQSVTPQNGDSSNQSNRSENFNSNQNQTFQNLNSSSTQNCDKKYSKGGSFDENIQNINNIPFNPINLGLPQVTFIPVQRIIGLPYQLMLPQLLQSGCFGKGGMIPLNNGIPLFPLQNQQQLLQQVQQQQKQMPNINKIQRQKKLERYRQKKQRRKALTKIRYPLRKANADQRPRIKGRFVRQNEFEKQSQKDEEEEDDEDDVDSMEVPEEHSSFATQEENRPVVPPLRTKNPILF